jgi:hypothetical protein
VASSPAFVGTGRVGVVNVATANTAIDGTGTITEVLAGVAAGTRVLEIGVKCAATSAAALVNIFLSTDSGSTWRLIDAITVTAVTVSTTVASFESSTTYQNLVLPSTAHRIGVTTTISQSTNVYALGGDL